MALGSAPSSHQQRTVCCSCTLSTQQPCGCRARELCGTQGEMFRSSLATTESPALLMSPPAHGLSETRASKEVSNRHGLRTARVHVWDSPPPPPPTHTHTLAYTELATTVSQTVSGCEVQNRVDAQTAD
jgi:hypothetical protein